MKEQSHINKEKLHKVPVGAKFEYRDIVEEDYPTEKHTLDGKLFKGEVQEGTYNGVAVLDDDGAHVVYKKEYQP